MGRRKLDNSTVVVVNKPPWHIYIGIGTPLLIAFVVFCLLFWPVLASGIVYAGVAVAIVVIGGFVLMFRARWNNQTIAIEQQKLNLRMLEASVREKEAQAVAAENAARYPAIDRTKYLFDTKTGAVIVEAMPQAIPGHAKLLADGEQPQQRRTLHQVIEDRRHIAILGHTGSGKTSTMAHALLIRKSINPEAMTILMDNHIKHSEWPPVNEVLWRHEDMASRFDWLWSDFLERKDPEGDHDEQPIIVVFDEFTSSKKHLEGIDKKYDTIITNLLQEAWKFGIYFIVGTHSMLVKEIGLSIDTRLNFTWLRLDKEDTKYNFGTLLDADFKPISQVELCGPYNGNSGGRFFSRTQQVRRLPPPTPSEDDIKLAEFCRLVNDKGWKRKDACQKVFERPYSGEFAQELAKKLKISVSEG